MNAIVAVDKKWGIGRNNGLLFSIPADMAFFREKTAGKVVVMGANTLKSFPGGRPLKNRVNVVVSASMENRDDCIVVRNLNELKEKLEAYAEDDVMLIGGGRLYHELLPYCKKAFVTKVDADGTAEVFFDNLDESSDWTLIKQEAPTVSNGYTITFTEYVNKNVKEL